MYYNKLKDILDAHKMWLDGHPNGGRAYLIGVNLFGVNLKEACLREAILRESDLNGVILSGADLKGADLKESSLIWADLRNADLSDANLRNADLSDANLRNANLRGANLRNANLRGANLRGVDLEGADLRDALLSESEKYRLGSILTDDLIGFKKCKDDVMVELIIPKGAIVFSINGVKCRTNKAIIKKIHGAKRAFSSYTYFSYYEGDIIDVKDFDLMYNVEYSNGIRFFKDIQTARKYKEI